MGSRFPRLSLADRGNLRIEDEATPAHIAGLFVLEPDRLPARAGRLDEAAIRRRLEARLGLAPVLRRVVHRPPPLCGPPLWVDDPDFTIARHVRFTRVTPPGGEEQVLELAERLLRPLLDRRHPLWELWFLSGLSGGRTGVLFKLHHSIADGLAAVAMMTALFDTAPDAPDPNPGPWAPAAAPGARALFVDAWRVRAGAAVRAVLRAPAAAAGLPEVIRETRRFRRSWSGAPPTSLTGLPGPGPRLRVVHLDLDAARAAAHRQGATINDVVLAVVTGGVRSLMLSRGERVAGVELRTSVPAALRTPDAARSLGNASGALLVALPVGEAGAVARLERIASSTRSAKAQQRAVSASLVTKWLAAAGLARRFAQRQRMVNFFVTNVPGPRSPLYVLGARVEEVIPFLGLAGNVTLMFAALSYCGRLPVAAIADRDACPDVAVLARGMQEAAAEIGILAAPALALTSS